MGYQLIEHIEVGSGGAASIEFTGIDQTGQDLVLLTSLRHSATWSLPSLRFNEDTTYANYTNLRLEGSGSSPYTEANTGANLGAGVMTTSAQTASTFASNQIYIPNYAGSTSKSWSVDGVQENNATAATQMILAGLWSGTAAITKVVLWSPGGGTFVQNSTASLYKITAD